ncbi:M55 family metallopeptidase [Thermosipho atlanticus]|uniref:D-aminopeptidase DppA. Metallo peptidase. MEROPS family M55 n=1 Tax=Thermosipho atlanticus DSM 15807 TaxID=1123380 RepID=A0A1M5SJT5_9BACT|nr:M55 family metallopeptidase [Thermosipho atlanticus]SHH38173.1 D-aminopeptidase DppA. Metallo peptidase. MEROPS family M55 [Thermosipho atlanticus DSM 15807]
MKIYVSVDFEGLGGIVQWSDVSKGNNYKQNYLMEQLRAFLKGVGDNYVLIVDSHASGDNVLWDITNEFHNVEIISGGLRKNYMMSGIDETFDRVVFFGYHASIGSKYSTMDHTYSSSSIHNIWINGQLVNEAIINAAFAGLYNVPISMVIGDDKLKDELTFFKNLYYVETKVSLGRFSAKFKPMKLLLKEIEAKTREMISKPRNFFESFKFKSPIELIIELSDTSRADLVEMLPLTERLDGRKIKVVHSDYQVIFDTILSVAFICQVAKTIGR